MVTERYESPFGLMTMAADVHGLCGLWFDGQKHFGRFGAAGSLDDAFRSRAEGDERSRATRICADTRAWLDAYFAGCDPGKTPPVHLRGSAFQREVWAQLTSIPYGRTTTYGAIAEELSARRAARGEGGRTSARAVGGAVGSNPVSIIVPCHRVLGAHRAITGYAGGLDVKRRLLDLEGIAFTDRCAASFRGSGVSDRACSD